MQNEFKSKNNLQRVVKAFGYSMAGLKAAYQYEAAFLQETWLAMVLIPLGFYLGNTNIERILLVGATLLVLVIELLNSALESAVDHTSLEKHALAKRAKDIGSAAVFMSMMIFVLVWGLILLG